MQNFLRALLLLIAINLLDNNILLLRSWYFLPVVHAEELKLPEVGPGEATFPECSSELLLSLAAFVGSIIALAVSQAVMGALATFASFSPQTAIAFGIALTVWMGTAIGVIVQYSQLVGCLWSFVRHPVMRSESGQYKYCEASENPNLPCPASKRATCAGDNATQDINRDAPGKCEYAWPTNKAEHSSYIEVCFRAPLGGFGKVKLDKREEAFTVIRGINGNISLAQVVKMKESVGGNLQCVTLKNGESKRISMHTYYARYEGAQICAYVGTLWRSAKVGCHLRAPAPPSPMCLKSKPKKTVDGVIVSYDNSECFGCYVSSACYGDASNNSKAYLPMTSTVVECIRESLRNILVSTCDGAGVGFLTSAQRRLEDAVKAVVLLAIVLFGYKLLSGGVGGMAEWTVFVLKIAFVLYLTIGGGMIEYYDKLLTLSMGIANIVLSSGGNQSICNFKDYPYRDLQLVAGANESEAQCLFKLKEEINRNRSAVYDLEAAVARLCPSVTYSALKEKFKYRDLSYLSLWDTLDCRVSFYLGQSLGEAPVSGGAAGAVGIISLVSLLGASVFLLIPLILVLMFSSQMVLGLLILGFVVLMILIIVWVVHLFILAIICLSILTLFSPIFIPMILFQVTKPFFEGWLKEVMAYSLYPIVLFGFIALVFSVFDKLYFDDLKFTKEIVDSYDGRSYFFYKLEDDEQCKKSKPGDTLPRSSTVTACMIQSISLAQKPSFFGMSFTEAADLEDSKRMWKNLGMLALVAFLFFHFLGILGGLAAELVGNFRADLSRHVTGPQAMAKKVAALSLAAGNTVASPVAKGGRKLLDKAKQMKNAKGDGESDKVSGNSGGANAGSGGANAGSGGANAG